MKRILTSLVLLGGITSTVFGQSDRDQINNFKVPGFKSVNVFEAQKDTAEAEFTGVKVRVGGDFALQFQGLRHSTSYKDTLATLGSNFNLPTANLNFDVQLHDGVRMSLVTYLSSRHHPEAWVKGGHIQVDKLDFIKKDFLKGLMDVVSFRMGLDEINYGDAHFRRSDNARAIYNPFVGNYLMDAFTTEAFTEINVQKNGFLVVGGLSNGNLNQTTNKGTKDLKASMYGKVGYDKQMTDDFRFRLTGSFYSSPGYDNGQYLYTGDRAGARYYSVMQPKTASDNFRSGRFAPGFTKYNSYQMNPFIKWKGLEFFGVYEVVSGDKSRTVTEGSYTQTAGELLYRIGKQEKVYVGTRFNRVTGKDSSTAEIKSVDRFNIGGGWFLTDNVIVKAEYMNQLYFGNGWNNSVFQKGNFKGFVLEAAISF